MLILGVDTSGRSGGITLAQGDEQSFHALESSPIAGGTFSAQLVPALATLLDKHRFTAKDIGAFSVASGPGSFTGLRVGLSAVKGLAEVLSTPIATVSLLEALAIISGRSGQVAAALDAGRSEIFAGLYEISPGQASRINENLLTGSEFLQQLSSAAPASIVTCDESVVQLVAGNGCDVSVEVVFRPGSELIARIGLSKVLRGQTVSAEELDANYIRRSDAELSFIKKMITVRQARSEDVPRMMEIAVHAATAALWTEGAYREFFAFDSGDSSPRRAILVIQENDNVAGFLAARQVADNEWEIENLAVSGSARRRGLASRLLGEFLNLVRDRGGSEIYLEVRESNRAARRLYEKWAFIESGIRRAYYHDPPEDALVLRFSFPQGG